MNEFRMVQFYEQFRQLVGSGFSIFQHFQFERKICFFGSKFHFFTFFSFFSNHTRIEISLDFQKKTPGNLFLASFRFSIKMCASFIFLVFLLAGNWPKIPNCN